jgi:hypothetical protein
MSSRNVAPGTWIFRRFCMFRACKTTLISQETEEKGMKIVAFGREAKVVENYKLIFKTHRVDHLHYLAMEGGMPIQEIKKELNVRQKSIFLHMA